MTDRSPENLPSIESSNERIEKLRKAVYDLAKNSKDSFLAYGKISEREYAFAMRLQKKYPDYKKYRAYHQLIGSTPPENARDGDFGGEDPVEEFYRSLLEELSIDSA